MGVFLMFIFVILMVVSVSALWMTMVAGRTLGFQWQKLVIVQYFNRLSKKWFK